MDFTINEKLYYKISDFCEYNCLDFNDYLEDCIVKQFNIDRYGDLNDILHQENSIDEVNEVKMDDNKLQLIIVQESGRETSIPISKLPIKELKKIWECNNDTKIEFQITNNINEQISETNKVVDKVIEKKLQQEDEKKIIKEEITKSQKPKKRVLKTK